MSDNLKFFQLKFDDIESGEHIQASFNEEFMLCTTLNYQDRSREIGTSNIASDDPITVRSMEYISGSDGYIVCGGWSDGNILAILVQVDNDGEFNLIDTFNNSPGNNCSNFAYSPEHGLVYASDFGNDVVMKLDVNSLQTGGTGYTQSQLTLDRFGDSYDNAFWAVGDYVYMAEDNSHSGVLRLDMNDDSTERIDIINYRNPGFNSYIADYEEDKDRIWVFGDNREMDVIEGASTVDPTGYRIRIRDTAEPFQWDDTTWPAVYHHSGEVYTFGTDRAMSKYDISPCLDPVSPADPVYLTGTEEKYESNTSNIGRAQIRGIYPDPSDRSYLFMCPDRDSLRNGGWYDPENYNIVGSVIGQPGYRVYWSTEDNRPCSYGFVLTEVTTEDGTVYDVLGGYGNNWSRLRSYASGTKPLHMQPSGHIVFGSYQLPNKNNIGAVSIQSQESIYELPGTSISFQVTNNSGQSWETVQDYTKVHRFSSQGNTFKMRIELSGTDTKTSYISSRREGHFGFILRGTGGINRRASFRLRGKA